MTWARIRLSDGHTAPGIAFGSATRRSTGATSKSVTHILTALKNGFVHLDTAQRIPREQLFITTKWSEGDMSPRQACEESLKQLGTDYIDLYVIHHTWTAKPDIKTAWRAMEELQQEGLVRSIGLSAFGYDEVKAILEDCKVKPAVNMIMLHPSVLSETQPLLDLMAENDIVPGGYSSLKPLWDDGAGSTVRETASDIAQALHRSPEHVLLRCAIVYTSSTSLERIESLIPAGDVEISSEHVKKLDEAGRGHDKSL
ncbi:hypothetical protein CI109_100002 [Kwoniella shandongensis]|uniref:NADP-dependent oxidoreductase domain-containing protein n=1 Tax=Kwoniella shandongensis TaxID=1734106 RepID=A0AAJ8MTJ3_9TREE